MPDTSQRSRIVIASLTALLLIGGAFFGGAWWRSAQIETDPPRPLAAGDATTSTSDAPDADTSAPGVAAIDTPAHTEAANTPTPWPPLPSPELPLADVLDELIDRARRGDNGAACRLGSELQRCLMARATSTAASNIEQDVARRDATPDGAVRTLVRMQRHVDRIGQGCEGVETQVLQQAFAWQKQAALADPALRVWFALSPALDPMTFVNDLDQWREYRTLALPWLQAAAADGDATAVIALARVYGDMRRTGPRQPPFRVHDDEQFVLYADLMQRHGLHVDVVAREAAAARARLSPEAQQRAQDRADALHRHAQTAPGDIDATSMADDAMRASLQPLLEPDRCGA